MNPLTMLADTVDGHHYEFTLEKLEGDTASLRLEFWLSNLDHRRDEPSKDDILRFYDIRFDKTRRLVCKAKMNGSYPTVTFMFHPAKEGTKPFVQIVIADTYAGLADGTREYPMEKDNYDALRQFLLDANFPDIEPSVIRNEKAVIRR